MKLTGIIRGLDNSWGEHYIDTLICQKCHKIIQIKLRNGCKSCECGHVGYNIVKRPTLHIISRKKFKERIE